MKKHLALLGPILVLLLLWAVLGLAVAANAPAGRTWVFFAATNQCLILAQTAIVAIAACGMTMIIVAGGIDLSCGSAIALTGVVAAKTMAMGCDPVLAIAAAIVAGAIIGTVNGSVITGARMMPFIVTLGMLGVARGMAKYVADNQTVNYPSSWLNALMRPLPIAPGVWIAAVLAAITAIVMHKTIFGRNLYAIGSNAAAARLCGIRVGRSTLLMYALAGAYFGLAGVMQTAKLTQGDPGTAIGLELDIIAAVVIGGASLQGGAGSIFGSMIGALIMAVLRNGSQMMGWPTYMQEIIIGVVIVIAVGLDSWRQRRSAAR